MKSIAELRMVTCCNCDKIIWDGFCYVMSSQYVICADCMQERLDEVLREEKKKC